ncbi:hypothetical protein HK099_002953, partial [Clydaea vesicula]
MSSQRSPTNRNEFLAQLLTCLSDDEKNDFESNYQAEVKVEQDEGASVAVKEETENLEFNLKENLKETVTKKENIDVNTNQLLILLNLREKEVKRLQLQNQQLFDQLKVSEPEPNRIPETSKVSAITGAMEKNIIQMVFDLSAVIPKINSKFTNNEVFNHLEHFDTYINTAKEHSLYHDRLCLMSSYNKLAEIHQTQ